MRLVETIQLQKNEQISYLCHLCKNLYNLGNYYINNYFKFIRNAKYLHQLDSEIQQDFLELLNRKRQFYYKKKKENEGEGKKKGKKKNEIKKRNLRCPKYLNQYNTKWILMKAKVYRKLPSQVAQNVLGYLHLAWKSYFSSLKDWKVNPEKYKEKPQPPHYIRKNGEYIACFNHQHIRIKKGFLHFPKKTNLKPIEVVTKQEELQQVRIVPKNDIYNLELVYNNGKYNLKLNSTRMIGIDIGVNNLACVVNNIDLKPFVINGRPLKSINHFYNKEKSRLQSSISKQLTKECKEDFNGKIYKKNGKHTKRFTDYVNKKATKKLQQTKRMKKLERIRKNKIKDYMHKASRYIVDFCIENNIGTIVIGKNPLWKQKIKMGRKNNQNFVQIPFNMLIEKIEYKSELVGINVEIITEEYTSKCSFLDNESIEKHDKYLGRRGEWKDNKFLSSKKGGRMFRSFDGRLINADVNGAYNIMKKAFPKAIQADGIKGAQLHPILINLNTKSKLRGIKTS